MFEDSNANAAAAKKRQRVLPAQDVSARACFCIWARIVTVLLIDIGNTRIKWARFEATRARAPAGGGAFGMGG